MYSNVAAGATKFPVVSATVINSATLTVTNIIFAKYLILIASQTIYIQNQSKVNLNLSNRYYSSIDGVGKISWTEKEPSISIPPFYIIRIY